jgi:hypothetical protein
MQLTITKLQVEVEWYGVMTKQKRKKGIKQAEQEIKSTEGSIESPKGRELNQ